MSCVFINETSFLDATKCILRRVILVLGHEIAYCISQTKLIILSVNWLNGI